MSGYNQQFNGYFVSALRWDQFDELWRSISACAEHNHWYVYAIGQELPLEPVSAEKLQEFLNEMSGLLRREHDEDYCGIVYADDLTKPNFIKIYDPNNLGMACGSSAVPVPPGWTISKAKPELIEALQPPAGRRRWWAKLFS